MELEILTRNSFVFVDLTRTPGRRFLGQLRGYSVLQTPESILILGHPSLSAIRLTNALDLTSHFLQYRPLRINR